MQPEVIAQLREAVGGQFVALYLVGSYGTPQQIATSDVDLILVHDDALPTATLAMLWTVVGRLRAATGQKINVRPMALSRCLKGAVNVKRVGRFLAGNDLRGRIREQTIEEEAHGYAEAGFMFVRRLRAMKPDAPIVPERLDYPDPSEPFRGYPAKQDELPLSRLMSLSFLATARLVRRAGVVPRTKHDIPHLYSAHFHDGTTAFVSAIFQSVRHDWRYLIPENAMEREELAEICRSALSFERIICADLLNT